MRKYTTIRENLPYSIKSATELDSDIIQELRFLKKTTDKWHRVYPCQSTPENTSDTRSSNEHKILQTGVVTAYNYRRMADPVQTNDTTRHQITFIYKRKVDD